MTPLAEFESCNQPRIGCRQATREEIDGWEGRVPAILLDHWRSVGWCGYADGAIWLTKPSDYEAYTATIDKLRRAPVIARTAFASLFLWLDEAIVLYTPETDQLSRGSRNPDIFFNSACCSQSVKKDLWDLADFRKLRKRLGPLEYDECFAPNPLPALGGSGDVSTMTKVKLLPFLEIARQAIAH